MIETKTYNDFSDYYYKNISEEQLLTDMEIFVQNGGDLNLDVLESRSSEKLLSFEEYIKKNFSAEFFSQIVQKNLVKNPFGFKLKNNKIFPLTQEYDLNWMRNNYNHYEEQILSNLTDFLSNNIIENSTVFEDSSEDSTYHHKYPALFYIAKKLNNEAKLWEVLLNNNDAIKKYLKEHFSDKRNFDSFIYNSGRHNTENLQLVLLKHDLFITLHEQSYSELHALIVHAIQKKDIDSLKILSSKVSFSEIESKKEFYDCFLKHARNPEIAQFLMDCGCFISGKWNGNEGHYINEINIAVSENMPNSTLECILDHPKNKDIVKKQFQYFFSTFFNHSPKFKNIQLLISKYGFPLEKYDMFHVSMNLDRFSDNKEDDKKYVAIKWLLESGADPRQCKKFVEEVVKQRDTGLRLLKNYAKQGFINPYGADLLYEMAKLNLTKPFIKYYEKTTSEHLSSFTIEGKPAWWGIKQKDLAQEVFPKISNFNQLSQYKTSWIYEILSTTTNKNKRGDYLEILKKGLKILNKNGIQKFDGSGKDSQNNNLLHHMFQNPSNYHSDIELIKFTFQNVDIDWNKLILEKNSDGLLPFECLFFDKEDALINQQSHHFLTVALTCLGKDFPFEQNLRGKSILQILQANFPAEIYENALDGYNKKVFSQNLELDLDTKDTKKSLKI